MADVSISKKPDGTVAKLTTPKRNANTQTFTSTWSVPSSHTSGSNSARATGITCDWQLELSSGNPWIRDTGGTSFTSSTLRLNSDWKFSDGKRYDRQDFWPYGNDRLYSVTCWVRETNSKGNGEWAKLKRNIEYPHDPVISEPEMSEQAGSAGNVSVTVDWDKDNSGYHDADRCQYWVVVTDTVAGTVNKVEQEGTRSGSVEGDAQSFTISYDAVNRMKLSWSDYIMVKFQAKAQGWRGNSNLKQRIFYVSYPNVPSITAVDVSDTRATGKVTALIDLNVEETHPVTGCVLEKLVGTQAQTAEEATASGNWQETGASDDGECSALAVAAEELLSGTTPGKSVWVRVKSWSHTEDIFYRYSEPWRVEELETPAGYVEPSDVSIISLIPGADGKSAVLTVGWNEETPRTGTEVSWADDANAWKSTKQPNTYLCTWNDGAITGYTGSATVHIQGLTEGTKYYVKARRYRDVDGDVTYSTYAQDVGVVMPVTAPEGVTLITPEFVARGEGIPCTWTYDSDAMQTAWQLVSGTLETEVDDTVTPPIITETFTEEAVLDSGTDATGGCIVPASRVGTAEQVALAVRVSTGGEWVQSKPKAVRIANAPEFTLSAPATLTAQPLQLSMTCSTYSDVAVVVTAQGATGSYPGGDRSQLAGDTVYADAVTPEWSNGAATVTLPDGLDLWDGAAYTVTARATDTATGLSSETAEAAFTVEWAHQAVAPTDNIEVTPHDDVADGFRTLWAEVELPPTQGMVSTDVYDVYRVTADNSYLVAEGIEQGATVTDHYAPYGGGLYRVAVRTADGDVDWNDYTYTLEADQLRIDFGPRYVELPYNLVLGDAYSKDFEGRAHLGAAVQEGYWNENVSRKATFGTDLLRVDADTVDALRALARYDGPCFVRMPNGCAYQANIDVSGLDGSYDNAAYAVALDGQEVALTDYLAEGPAAEIPEGE